MNEKLEKKTEEAIERILKEGIATTNLDHLYKLTKINHMMKEEENMILIHRLCASTQTRSLTAGWDLISDLQQENCSQSQL